MSAVPHHIWLDSLEQRSYARFSRWMPQAWQQFTGTALVPLAQAMAANAWGVSSRDAVLQAFAGLGAEAVGLGYLFFETGAPGGDFLSWLWKVRLPAALACLPTPSAAVTCLAQCWNLTENLASHAGWFNRLLWLERGHLTDILELDAFLTRMDAVIGPAGLVPWPLRPEQPRDWQVIERVSFSLRDADRSARPAGCRFLTPRLIEIRDLRRTRNYLVLLRPEPQFLGEADAGDLDAGAEAMPVPDPRVAALGRAPGQPEQTCAGGAANDWFRIFIPELSQRIVVAWVRN